jgi:hypothetical protein
VFSVTKIAVTKLAALSKALKIFDCSNTGDVVLNPTRGKDVYPHFSMLCWPV